MHKIDNYLEIILDNIDEGIHIVDESGRTVIYNQKMAELENMEKSAVLGKKLLDIFPSLTENSSTLLQTLKSGRAMRNIHQEYLNKYGQKITTISTTIPIKFANGTIWALEIARDITEIKNLYYKIIRLQEKLYSNQGEDSLNSRLFTFADIKGEDEKLKQVLEYARQAAATDSSILIVGETGTGKELFAQSIHSGSRRRNRPFIAQNCAALPENLLEGILFGTRRGGFTGAINRKGLFEQADGGTLLLDEINALSPGLQAKLLRVLQEGTVRPVGGKEDIKVDVRIITTINTPPVEAIKKGNLREDLFYRLAVVQLYLPLLAERRGDILLLSNHFIKKFNQKLNCKVEKLSDRVKEIFLSYSWPGNVRQLEHIIEGAMNIIGEEKVIREEHIRPFLIDLEGFSAEKEKAAEEELKELNDAISLPARLEEIEKKIIIDTLQETEGNITRAARKLGIKRQSLQYRLDKYNLSFRS